MFELKKTLKSYR